MPFYKIYYSCALQSYKKLTKEITSNDAVGKRDEFMRRVFRWFGTYLAWIPDDKAKCSRDGRGEICETHLIL